MCLNPNGDNEPLIKNNIYVVSISATPMAEFLNANISEFKKKIVPLKNSKGYFGIVDMFENDQVFHSYDLKSNLSVDRFLDTILSIKKNGYILVRCTKKQQIAIESRIVQRNITKLSLIDYFRNSKNMILDNQGINDIIEQLPNNKTLIFLRVLLRAGKRLNTENIVMVHDTSESKVDTAVQSLLGRCCGYNKNKDILIYCDKISAEKYKNWSFLFEYFPDETPANIQYQRMPKNGLVLTSINKNGKYEFTTDELIEYARLFNVDSLPIIFEGKLSDTMKEAIQYFLNTSEKDLEYVFGEQSFSFFFYKILNPQSESSFLMKDSFQENLEKIIIRVKDKDISFEILNPLYQRISSENSTDFTEMNLSLRMMIQTVDLS